MEDIQGSLALEPVEVPAIPDKLPALTVTEEQWIEVTSLVIDNLEGGYYHPDMKKHFNAKSQQMLGDSGETMFGLDRKHGAQLSKFAEWKTFWGFVDADKQKNPAVWKYNKRGGAMENTLKVLAAKIMFKWFSYLAGKYILISSMDEIAADKRLLIHFSYASWNGEGFFMWFSNALNEAIKKYEGDKEMIFRVAFDERINAFKYIRQGGKWVKTTTPNMVIRQQGKNMMDMFKRMNLIK